MTGNAFVENLRNALFPNRAAPVLARVTKAHEGPGDTKYSCDVRVLTAGTLEETDREIADVPLNPIWVGRKGRGVYAMPPENSVVVVEFVGWNIAFPYVAGIWSDGYEAGEFTKDQIVMTDGEGTKFGIDADALFMFETKRQSLKKVLEKMVNTVAKIETKGAPPQHLGSPDWITEMKKILPDIAELLK